jgi:iron complex outermembrane receptor protein
VINVITRDPAAQRPGLETEVRFTTPGTELGEDLGARVTQRVSGRRGDVSYTVGATGERTPHHYDAEGDLIPPDPKGQGGVADATGLDLFGKAAFHLAPDQDLTVSANRYRFVQEEIEYRTVPGTPGEEKTRAEPGEPRSQDVGNEHTALHARYQAADLLLDSSVEPDEA